MIGVSTTSVRGSCRNQQHRASPTTTQWRLRRAAKREHGARACQISGNAGRRRTRQKTPPNGCQGVLAPWEFSATGSVFFPMFPSGPIL